MEPIRQKGCLAPRGGLAQEAGEGVDWRRGSSQNSDGGRGGKRVVAALGRAVTEVQSLSRGGIMRV